MNKEFERSGQIIKAQWDEQACVYRSESDIEGLHIETDSLSEFETVLDDVISDLVVAS